MSRASRPVEDYGCLVEMCRWLVPQGQWDLVLLCPLSYSGTLISRRSLCGSGFWRREEDRKLVSGGLPATHGGKQEVPEDSETWTHDGKGTEQRQHKRRVDGHYHVSRAFHQG
ncbi:hypothetical protein STEG23_031481 [Scotinomys teguina]